MFSTESAHFKHDGLISPWNFYKYHTWDMYGVAECRSNRISKNYNKHNVRFLKIHTLKIHLIY